MTYKAFYHGKAGKVETTVVEASSRTELFAELKKRGITSVIRVQSMSGNKKEGAAPLVKGLVAGVLVVAILLVAFYFVSGKTDDLAEIKNKVSSRLSRLIPEKRSTGESTAQVEEDRSSYADEKVDAFLKRTAAEMKPVETNNVNDIGIEYGRKVKELGVTAVDQLVNMATSAPIGIPPPPLPVTEEMKDDLRNMLKHPIEFKETDTEEMRIIKDRLAENRRQLQELLDQGYSVTDVLMQHQELTADNTRIRNEVMLELREIEESGDEEGVREYLLKMNIALQQMGIDPVYSSDPIRDRLQLERERSMQNTNVEY